MVHNFLDMDPSIMVRNLSIRKEDESPLDFASQLTDAISDSSDRVKSITITPSPGYCLKGRTGDGEKVFINICHCQEIPEGEPISDEHLLEIITLEKEYVFPISVGHVHYETNKNGEIVSVYDVALNTTFYQRITCNDEFRNFVSQMIFSAVQQKFSINIPPEGRSILKRRTFFGTIKPQLIEKRPVQKLPKNLIQEVDDLPNVTSEMVEERNPKIQKKLKLTEEIEDNKKFVVGYLKVNARSGSDFSLFVGEDRILLQSSVRNLPLLDFFLPAKLDPDDATAMYSIREKLLKIKVAIKG